MSKACCKCKGRGLGGVQGPTTEPTKEGPWALRRPPSWRGRATCSHLNLSTLSCCDLCKNRTLRGIQRLSLWFPCGKSEPQDGAHLHGGWFLGLGKGHVACPLPPSWEVWEGETELSSP